MEENRKETDPKEEDCKPLTDEEFREFQEKDQRTTNKVKKLFSAIWEAVNFFT